MSVSTPPPPGQQGIPTLNLEDNNSGSTSAPGSGENSASPPQGNIPLSTSGLDQHPHHLFNLPQEIQDLIFDYAYPAIDDVITLCERRHWENCEKYLHRNEQSYVARPFQHNIINEFMVSKRFFINAARAYVGTQTWHNGPLPAIGTMPTCTRMGGSSSNGQGPSRPQAVS
jgi:hypothetical protein